jgi:hypothetical protein
MVKAENMWRYGILAVLLVVALLVGMLAMSPVARAQSVVLQLAIPIDGSGSIDATEFNLMREGLASAVEDPTIMPQTGVVEVCVQQFAGDIAGGAQVEVSPTVIDSQATADTVAATIRGITQVGGLTPTGAGITLALTEMQSSANWNVATRHVIDISTNGHPEPDSEVQIAIDARDAAIAAGVTEINAVAVGVTTTWLEWLRDNIVYPQPGTIAPPYTPGFVVEVTSFDEYAEAIATKIEKEVEPVPGIVGWGIAAAVIALGGAMFLVLRRRQAHESV